MADGINKVILVGNLGKDPELTYTQGGTPVYKFSLATGEKFKGKDGEWVERTEWHSVVVWGKQGESAGKYLQKGRQVYLEGKLQTRSWDDEKTGQKRYMTEVNAQRVVFLGGNGDGQRQQQPQQAPPQDSFGGGYGPDGDDMPF
jgi:single-strand DNA-binding protein